jgi:hypothetical protein
LATQVLGDVYKDLIESFMTPNPALKKSADSLSMFHMGGDEVNFQCWFQGSILQNFVSAKNVLDKFSASYFVQISTQKQHR